MTAQIIEKGYISRQFFNLFIPKLPILINSLSLLTGLLISAPGTRFPRGGPGAPINSPV